MGAKAQGLIVAIIGVFAALIGYGAETQIEGSGPLIWVGFLGLLTFVGGIAWAIIGSRYTVERR